MTEQEKKELERAAKNCIRVDPSQAKPQTNINVNLNGLVIKPGESLMLSVNSDIEVGLEEVNAIQTELKKAGIDLSRCVLLIGITPVKWEKEVKPLAPEIPTLIAMNNSWDEQWGNGIIASGIANDSIEIHGASGLEDVIEDIKKIVGEPGEKMFIGEATDTKWSFNSFFPDFEQPQPKETLEPPVHIRPCGFCDGSGLVDMKRKDCPICGGKGFR